MVVLVFRVRSNRSRAQSPCSPGQYPPSPLRQRAATTPGTDDRGHNEVKGHSTMEKKLNKSENSEKKIPKSTSKELNAGKSTVCAMLPVVGVVLGRCVMSPSGCINAFLM